MTPEGLGFQPGSFVRSSEGCGRRHAGDGLYLLTQEDWGAAAALFVIAATNLVIFFWGRRSYAKHGSDNWRYNWAAFFRLFRRR